MKWKRNKCTANEGVLFVESVVNEHGSIFRPVHQETDVGIDGHIEFVNSENVTGRLVAVQVKSGDCYVDKDGQSFRVAVDEEHLQYWCSYFIPVILVCYSPSRRLAAWIPVREYVRHEKYHDRIPVSVIQIPFRSEFNAKSMSEGVASLAHADADRRVLIDCVDNCIAGDSRQKLQGLSILGAHPDSRDSRITAFLARRLLFDDDQSVADTALRTISYHVGRFQWSWNPNNRDERELISYASDLCEDLSPDECRRLIERLDDEWFGGPVALGDRVFFILSCCDASQTVMEEIAADKSLPMQRRINALYMLFGCDDADLLDYRELKDNSDLGDVYRAMYADELKEAK